MFLSKYIMYIKFVVFVTVIFFISCTSLEKEYNVHLRNGISTYPYTREVNLNFIDNYSVKKIAFIKKNKKSKILVLKLNDKVNKKTVENFSLAIKTYLNKEKYNELLNGKSYISTPVKPDLLTVNGHNYITIPYELNIKRFDSIEFFLFHRDKFRKVLSKPIRVKNMGI